MAELKYLFIHETETSPGKEVSSDEIRQWHMGPKDLPNGEVKYMKKIYTSREILPKEKIGGIFVKNLVGRGWYQVGYSDMIHLDGKIENLVSYNENNWVDASEITNGASGYNANSRHIVIVGGKGFKSTDDFDKVLTPEQFVSLQMYVKEFLGKHPNCKVLGHYQVNPNKQCPGFDVPKFLKFISIPDKFIFS